MAIHAARKTAQSPNMSTTMTRPGFGRALAGAIALALAGTVGARNVFEVEAGPRGRADLPDFLPRTSGGYHDRKASRKKRGKARHGPR